jgi:hypothetical protein
MLPEVGDAGHHPASRRILSWLRTWAANVPSPTVTVPCDDDGLSLERDMGLLCHHVLSHSAHRSAHLSTLFVAALARPDLDPDGALLRFASQLLVDTLPAEILPDGAPTDPDARGEVAALGPLLVALANARGFGMPLPTEFEQRLERACEFALHTDPGRHTVVLQLAGELFRRPDFLYGATAGARGTRPHGRSPSFWHGGFVVQRRSWDEQFAVFDSASLTVSFAPTSWASIVRHSFSTSDTARTPVTTGRITCRFNEPGLDLVCAEARDPFSDTSHTRWLVFIDDDYWLVLDRLEGVDVSRSPMRIQFDAEGSSIADTALQVICAPSVQTTTRDRGSAAHLLMLIGPKRDVQPRLTIRECASVMTVEVFGVGRTGNARDLVTWGPSGATWVRWSATGKPIAFHTCGAPGRPQTGLQAQGARRAPCACGANL